MITESEWPTLVRGLWIVGKDGEVESMVEPASTLLSEVIFD